MLDQIKSYCINLDSRSDRWGAVQKEFHKVGIEPERFPAIKHEQGWRGAMLSHQAVIMEAKRQGLKEVLVFEDDIEFLVTDKEYYENLFNSLPRYYETKPLFHVLYLGGTYPVKLKKYNDYIYYARNVLALQSVVYHQLVYDRILECDKVIDTWIANRIQPLMNCFVASKMCTTQVEGWSDIEKSNQNYKEWQVPMALKAL